MLFRFASSALILAAVISVSSCGRKARRADRDKIDLDQSVTIKATPKDVIFSDFKNNWRKFVSEAPEFTMAVAPRPQETPRQAPEPVILTNCVFSEDAGGYVPQITIIWTEAPGGGTTNQPPGVSRPPATPAPSPNPNQAPNPNQPPTTAPPTIAAAAPPATAATRQAAQGGAQDVAQAAQMQAKAESGQIRFDLAVQFDGFQRNLFSTALSNQKDKRFNLPANSELVRQEDALLLTGPSLFPKLMDFKSEVVRDRDTNRDVGRQTLVLRDLSQGLSYNLRMSTLGANQWQEVRGFNFLTPVCPNSF